MTTTTSTTSQAPAQKGAAGERTRMTPAPDNPPVPTRTRRRPALIGLGVALVVLGTLGGAWLGTQLDDAEQVLVLAQDKQAGDVLTEADLRAVPVSSSGTDLAYVPLEDADQVQGQLLTGNVPAGTVLAPGMLAPEPTTPAGTYIVGIPLSTGQLPAVGLRPGDEVFLVMGVSQSAGSAPAPAAGAEGEPTLTAAQELTEPGRAWSAEVVGVGQASQTDGTGAITVDVAITRADAADVAAAAATRAMSVVLQPATGDEDEGGGEDR